MPFFQLLSVHGTAKTPSSGTRSMALDGYSILNEPTELTVAMLDTDFTDDFRATPKFSSSAYAVPSPTPEASFAPKYTYSPMVRVPMTTRKASPTPPPRNQHPKPFDGVNASSWVMSQTKEHR